MTKMALEGYRVGDWSVAAAGPSTGVWLAAFGAEVIKIESRDGDMQRDPAIGQLSYGVPKAGAKDISTWWELFNYNKKSITVNLKKDKGREVIYRLVKTLDAFSHNQLPDTVDKLGMDYETLTRHNPNLIYATNTVFGSKGPRRLFPAMDPFGQAVSGLMMTSGGRGDPPTFAGPGAGDFAGGFSVTCGIILALLHRERSGEAQRVESSQLQACMNIVNFATLGQYLLRTEEQRQADPTYGEPRPDRRVDARDPSTNYYRCKDDRWVMVGGRREKNWEEVCEALGEPELATNSKFSSRVKRTENREELFALLERIFASRTAAEWEHRFQGKDCGFTPINRLRDLPNDPQVVANDLLFTFDHPAIGRYQYPGPPFHMSKTPASIKTPAPGLGEHTDEILMELGYSPEEVIKLHEEEVV